MSNTNNKKIMKYNKLIVLVISAMVAIGCNQPASIQNELEGLSDQEFEQTENFVDMYKATSIASTIKYPLTSSPNDIKLKEKGATSKFKEIEKILAIPDNNGNPSYYIVNYKEDGFIMISADNRINPVRAYSLTENFPMDSDSLPSGLLGWMMESSEMVSQIRVLNKEQTLSAKKSWDNCEIQRSLGISGLGLDLPCDGDGGGGCEDQYTQVGPLLTTTWGQWAGYNNTVPHTGCNSSNGRAPAGCVATAMAQIMKYYKHLTVKDQLKWEKPVILVGFREKGFCFLGWCSYNKGHAWVTDGYKETTYCETGTSYLYLHMNWGWSGSEDGWYGYNNWNPGDRSYNYKKEMIYNINP